MNKLQVHENVIDKMVGFIDPVRAHSRMQARARIAIAKMALNGKYQGGSRTREGLKRFLPGNGSPDADLKYDREDLVGRSRDLIRNNPIAAGAINTNDINVVGTGLKPRPSIGERDRKFLGMTDEQAEEFEDRAEREFKLWAENQDCDIARTLNFYSIQNLVYRQTNENGEVFVTFPRQSRASSQYTLRLQVIESDRVCNENNITDRMLENGRKLVSGIEKNRNGAPAQYHVCKEHPGNLKFTHKEWVKIPAFGEKTGLRNVLHLYHMLRPDQTRGVPYLAPVIEHLKQISRYTEAELMAAVVQGMFTVFIQSETDPELDPTGKRPEGAEDDEEYGLGYGSVVGLGENEKIETANPTRPSTAFDPFMQAICQQVGVALGIPVEVLLLHFTASYSASRAALLEAWKFFRTRRQWLIWTFCQPVYEMFMWEAVARGTIYAPGFFDSPAMRKAYLSAVWTGDGRGHINPAQEANAVKTRTEIGLTTMEQEKAEYNGSSFEKDLPQIRRERREMQGEENAAN